MGSEARPVSGALRELSAASQELSSLTEGVAPDRLHHLALSALHRFMAAAFDAEAAGTSLAERREHTRAAREFAARQSPTFAHAQNWPYGYPGDFRIVERMLDDAAPGERGSLPFVFEGAVLGLPIVVQHRLKVRWQAELVRRRLAERGKARVLSIGCGGCRDLTLLRPEELSRLTVVLCDIDRNALDLATARLSHRVERLEFHEGNALRRMGALRRAAPFDVILIGGLLDYLSEKAAATLLRHSAGLLGAGGVLGCTNIVASNPWRPAMELLADWPLVERTRGEMERLLGDFGASRCIDVDPTRLTWLAQGVRD